MTTDYNAYLPEWEADDFNMTYQTGNYEIPGYVYGDSELTNALVAGGAIAGGGAGAAVGSVAGDVPGAVAGGGFGALLGMAAGAAVANMLAPIPKKDRAELIAAYVTAQTTIDTAMIESQTAAYVAKTESEASVATARTSAVATMYGADKELEAVEVQSETDLEIAKLEYEIEKGKLEVEMESIEKVDAVNAQANLTASQALVVEAGAKQTKAEGEKAKDEAEALEGSTSSWG